MLVHKPNNWLKTLRIFANHIAQQWWIGYTGSWSFLLYSWNFVCSPNLQITVQPHICPLLPRVTDRFVPTTASQHGELFTGKMVALINETAHQGDEAQPSHRDTENKTVGGEIIFSKKQSDWKISLTVQWTITTIYAKLALVAIIYSNLDLI